MIDQTEQLEKLKEQNLNLKFEKLDAKLSGFSEEFNYKLDKILEQTTKTNGSVINLTKRTDELEKENMYLRLKLEDNINKLSVYETETKLIRNLSSTPKAILVGILLLIAYLFNNAGIRRAIGLDF